MKKHIIVIGTGSGGLTSAMQLAHHGFDVSIYEKESKDQNYMNCISRLIHLERNCL